MILIILPKHSEKRKTNIGNYAVHNGACNYKSIGQALL